MSPTTYILDPGERWTHTGDGWQPDDGRPARLGDLDQALDQLVDLRAELHEVETQLDRYRLLMKILAPHLTPPVVAALSMHVLDQPIHEPRTP